MYGAEMIAPRFSWSHLNTNIWENDLTFLGVFLLPPKKEAARSLEAFLYIIFVDVGVQYILKEKTLSEDDF